jgi:predicted small lipoprotein YifL
MLTRPIAVLLLAFLVLQLTGCGAGTPAALPRKNMRYVPAPLDVSHQIAVTLNQFQDNFTRADWGAVEHQFVDQSAGLDLVRQMKFWRQEEVSTLHITLLYTRRLNAAAYVDDPVCR